MPTLSPDTSLSYRDVILRVAEETQLAFYDSSSPDTPADIPQDRQILDKIKRAVNDGMDRMARAYPKWTSLRPQFTFDMFPAGDGPLNGVNPLTGARDPSIYRLPWYVTSQPIHGWQWSSQGSSFGGAATSADPETVDRLHRQTPMTSFPRMAAIVPSPIQGDAGDDRQTRAVRFYPSPDQNYRVTARFLVSCPKMVQLSDKHIFGASHDQTVVAFAVWCIKEHDAKDPAMRATYEARAMRALAESVKIDQEGAQPGLGRMTDPDVDNRPYRFVNPGLDIVTSSMTPVLT